MLRAVRLKNFIKFRDDTLIAFPFDGAYFFVGENGSGKTSVYEAVRRCLNLALSTSFSTVTNEAENMYIICEYDTLPNKPPFKMYTKLFTSYVRISNETNKYGKIVLCLGRTEGKSDVFMEIVTRLDPKDYKVANCQVILNRSEKNELITTLSTLTKSGTNDALEMYLKCVALIMTRKIKAEIKPVITETDVERILRALNKCVVITFAQRSIGPLQWSKSVRIKPKERERNYSLARTRCEIITAFLSGQHKYNKTEEERLFKALTGESNIIFQRLDRKENIKVTIDNQPVEILKVPQGILEAKNLSLLLSSTEFTTVLLEEPDNGMHPQMIQKIRDILLPQIKEKVIIVITHNPAFIDALTIYKTIKFYRDDTTSRVILVGDELKSTKTEHKTARLVASEEYTNILFARKVFFVEGGSDYLFIKNLFSHLLNPSKTNSSIQVLKKAKVGENDGDCMSCLDKLRHLIASLHVVSMGGEKSKVRWNFVSHILKTPRIFLLDRDVVVEKDLKSVPEIVEKTVTSSLKKMLKGKKNEDEIISLAQDLQRKAWEVNLTTDLGNNIDLNTATKRLRERLENLTNTISDVDVNAYRDYYFAVSKNFQEERKTGEKFTINPQPDHLITKLKPKETIECVSKDAEKSFKDSVRNNNWNKARKCLQDEGVFVWKEGDLEDSFMEIILETEEGMSEENKMYRIHERHKTFSTLNLRLDLMKHFRGKSKPNKLYMDDDVSVVDIEASIDSVLRLCSEKSDIAKLIAFLFRCANGDVKLLPNIE